MSFVLDTETEQRVLREMDRGHYREPAEVLTHALNLLQAEEEWLAMGRSALDERLSASMSQIDRGEGIASDRLLDALSELRRSRAARA